MFTVKITPQAAEDLLEIKNYIENELKNPIAAHNTIKTIVETYENLSTDYFTENEPSIFI